MMLLIQGIDIIIIMVVVDIIDDLVSLALVHCYLLRRPLSTVANCFAKYFHHCWSLH